MPKTNYRNPLSHGEFKAILETLSLEEDHKQHLLDNAISEDIIERRCYRTAADSETLRRLQFSEEQAQVGHSLVLPLWWGNMIVGVQIRPDTPRMNELEKSLKYESPARVANVIDATPSVWDDLINPDQPLWITEGTKKVDALASVGEVAIGLSGVWGAFQARTDEEKNRDAPKVPLQQWFDICIRNRKITLGFDNDAMIKVEVHRALVETATLLTYLGAQVEYLYLPLDTGEKIGIDDFLASHGSLEELKAHVEPELRPTPAFSIDDVGYDGDDTMLSRILAERFQNRIAFDQITKQWRGYGDETENVWAPIQDDSMLPQVADSLDDILKNGCSTSKARNVMAQLRGRCGRRFDQAPRYLLPMANGVLNIETKELTPHGPEYGFTWCLPYGYCPEAKCYRILEWLEAATQGCRDFTNILIAFAKAVVEGRSDLEVFLEIVGPGGTGKSTYLRLLKALVGAKNAVQTEMRHLEKQFETARFYGKRLVCMPDEAAYSGSVDTLKKLTGRDPMRYEQKRMQAGEDFTYEGMVVIAANQMLQSPDRSSGLDRRRITVPFLHRPEERRCLIDFRGHGEPIGELADELPGFLNLVLDMKEEEMRDLLKEFGRGTGASKAMHLQTLLETNPIAAWAEDRLVYMHGVETQIGRKEQNLVGNKKYKHQDEHLYPSYVAFCEATGKQVVGLVNFSRDFEDLSQSQLGRKDVQKKKKANGTFILNVRMRFPGEDDHLPRFVTGEQV